MSTIKNAIKTDTEGLLVNDASAEPKGVKRARTNRQNPLLSASGPPLSHAPPTHGYGEQTVHDSPRHIAIKPLPQAQLQPDADIDPHLRDLRASRPPPVAPTANMMQSNVTSAPPPSAPMTLAGPPVSLIPPVAPMLHPHPLDGEGADGRKNKRELSQSKRAAQNRAAQRAFRQRKEVYIKSLEIQVSEMNALRDYAALLANRLMEAGAEIPPPPPNVNLSQPMAHVHDNAPPTTMPEAPSSTSAASTASLDAVAQAVADLAEQQLMENQHYANQAADSNEEVHKLLGNDGLPRQP